MRRSLQTSSSCLQELLHESSGKRRLVKAMVSRQSEVDDNYRAAISALNGLQTNAATLDLIRRRGNDRRVSEYNRMQQYLDRVGISTSHLTKLNAIHVAGTKGKGSVCAMTESILRHHGRKTGLFVSPHLLEVRERIRIDGQPLTRELFVSYFWDVYNKLHSTRHLHDNTMPSYFRFLTVMAFSVFLDSGVDVAVVEVGIGGTHDSTNIIQHPVVCGITSLGYDHTDILGPSLSDIAWHKAGICKFVCSHSPLEFSTSSQHKLLLSDICLIAKRQSLSYFYPILQLLSLPCFYSKDGRPVYTVDQTSEAVATLSQRAKELGALNLSLVPLLSSYHGPIPELGLKGRHQLTNASLAIQLSNCWLRNSSSSSSTSSSSSSSSSTSSSSSSSSSFSSSSTSSSSSSTNPPSSEDTSATTIITAASFPLSKEIRDGLRECRWAGRNQVIERGKMTYYIDGAHTPESLVACTHWFLSEVKHKNYSLRVLLFNTTGNRDSETFLQPLLECGFGGYVFSPNLSHSGKDSTNSPDRTSRMVTDDSQLSRCLIHQQSLKRLLQQHIITSSPSDDQQFSRVCGSVSDAVEYMEGLSSGPAAVLVTGSLHLVGSLLNVLGLTVEDL